MKIYAFFLYVPEERRRDFVLVNRYRTTDPKITISDWERYLYAYTTKKKYRDQFLLERDMKLFGKSPTTIDLGEEEYLRFDNHFMGRELEVRGVKNHKFVVNGGNLPILGTCDEFSYAQYDFPDLLCPNAEAELPFANIFVDKYKFPLITLSYPFECLTDFFDMHGWMDLDTWSGSLILDERAVFIKYFSNLFRDPKKRRKL